MGCRIFKVSYISGTGVRESPALRDDGQSTVGEPSSEYSSMSNSIYHSSRSHDELFFHIDGRWLFMHCSHFRVVFLFWVSVMPDVDCEITTQMYLYRGITNLRFIEVPGRSESNEVRVDESGTSASHSRCRCIFVLCHILSYRRNILPWASNILSFWFLFLWSFFMKTSIEPDFAIWLLNNYNKWLNV